MKAFKKGGFQKILFIGIITSILLFILNINLTNAQSCECLDDVEIRTDGSWFHPSEAIWIDHYAKHDNGKVDASYDFETLQRGACDKIRVKSKIDFVKGKSKKIFAQEPTIRFHPWGPVYKDVSIIYFLFDYI